METSLSSPSCDIRTLSTYCDMQYSLELNKIQKEMLFNEKVMSAVIYSSNLNLSEWALEDIFDIRIRDVFDVPPYIYLSNLVHTFKLTPNTNKNKIEKTVIRFYKENNISPEEIIDNLFKFSYPEYYLHIYVGTGIQKERLCAYKTIKLMRKFNWSISLIKLIFQN